MASRRCDVDAYREGRLIDECGATVVVARVGERVLDATLQVLATGLHRLFDDGGIEHREIGRRHRIAELFGEEFDARFHGLVDVRGAIDPIEHGLRCEQIALLEGIEDGILFPRGMLPTAVVRRGLHDARRVSGGGCGAFMVRVASVSHVVASCVCVSRIVCGEASIARHTSKAALPTPRGSRALGRPEEVRSSPLFMKLCFPLSAKRPPGPRRDKIRPLRRCEATDRR